MGLNYFRDVRGPQLSAGQRNSAETEGSQQLIPAGAARLPSTRIQFVECALQLFQLLSSLAEFAFRRQALVVAQVFGSLRDKRI